MSTLKGTTMHPDVIIIYGYMLRPTCMFMDRMIAPIIVQSISKNYLQNVTAETFCPGTTG